MSEDKRLIEDYLPIEKISEEASREKSVRKGHISTLHLWWARRPLVACRAAVYGALVPASQFIPENGPDNKKQSLGRANAARFVERLCKYPGDPNTIAEAQRHILAAHAERLSIEAGKTVTVEDIEAGLAPRPKVLDMFAGGGAIPLEALRLGCETYARDLNPVAHIIELCTLVYPQKYGKPDTGAHGMTGPKNAKGEPTWGGLAGEFRYWGHWVLEKVRAEIGDLYPPIPDPDAPKVRQALGKSQLEIPGKDFDLRRQRNLAVETPAGHLTPVAYLWTRTVRCKNPHCAATVPLVKQTWLCKKQGRYVALRIVAPRDEKAARFRVVEVQSQQSLGFDPAAGSRGGNATCPFCGTVADIDYVKAEGSSNRLGDQLVAVVAAGAGGRGWKYFSATELPEEVLPDNTRIAQKLAALTSTAGITIPTEYIAGKATPNNSLGITVKPYGISRFHDLFTQRQLLFHMSVVAATLEAQRLMAHLGTDQGRIEALASFLACAIDRGTDFGCRLCMWNPYKDSGTTHAFGRQTITMVWDYSEVNPFNLGNASWKLGMDRIIASLDDVLFANPGKVARGSAAQLPYEDNSFDAIVTDPPYYDNVPYSDVSDFFYVWLKRSIASQFPDHFANQNAPKKSEAIADAHRHNGDWDAATRFYEQMMAQSFTEAARVLKSGGQLVIVYAHKTTLGWATLVEALRRAGFTVTEAWPLDTEFAGRLRSHESAALASSIFLVARRREGKLRGKYDEVRPKLDEIVRERVNSLWDAGVTGADLVIACVGAGLRAFTRFDTVEYSNGEEVPAERFLAEVESVVLETILSRLSKEIGACDGRAGLGSADRATRFYLLWRYTYKTPVLDSGEAIVFANGTEVELDGPNGLSTGRRRLVEKKQDKYRLLDFTERGEDEGLGLIEDGRPAPLVDVLHRTLWLMENHVSELPGYLREVEPNREQLRLVTQALAGPALKGGELGITAPPAELSALAKLRDNWRSVVEDAFLTAQEREDRRTGQSRISYEKGNRR